MSHMFAGKTFFAQTFAALPGKSRDFIRAYKESFAPMLERRGLRKVAFWQTSMLEEPSNEFQWVAKRAALLLRQRSQHIDEFQKSAMSTRFCWHETMIIQPNREQDYVLGIEAQLGRSYDLQGMQMVGEFQAVFRSGPIINFWTVPNGFDSIALMGRQEADDFHSGQYWMDIAVALREHWRSVWLVPLPIDLKA